MATIIEVRNDKIEHLSECVEKILKYGGKMMHCLEEMQDESEYAERSSRKYDEKHKEKRKKHYDEDEEFMRYY